MKVLDKFVLKNFFYLFLLVIATFISIFLIVDVIEKIDIFIKNRLTIDQAVMYYLYQLPFFVNIALPMSLLIATVFTLGFLKKNNELAAIKSSGISMYRVSAPLLIAGVLFTLFSFVIEDYLVIPANRKRIEIERDQLKRRKYRKKTTLENLSFQDSQNCNVFIRWYSVKMNYGKDISIQYFNDNVLIKRVDAKTVKWDEKEGTWRIKNYILRELDPEDGQFFARSGIDSTVNLRLKPEDMTFLTLNPEGMRIKELRIFIKRIASTGNDPARWLVNLHYKFAFPFTCFIVILIGIPISVLRPGKDIAFGAGFSLLLIFIYYGLIKFGQSLGYHQILPPALSVWIANCLYFVTGGYLFYRIRQ